MPADIQRKTFTVAEYHLMAEIGILKEDDRVELIEGEIISMAAIGSVHAACVNRLNQLFTKAFSDRALVSVQNPIALDHASEPEPDIALLKPRPDFYADGHPGPDDIHLIVEVADTSLEYDRKFKLPLYARAGIREAWLVSLAERRIEAHTLPSAQGYKMIRRFLPGEAIVAEAFVEVSLSVDAILGK